MSRSGISRAERKRRAEARRLEIIETIATMAVDGVNNGMTVKEAFEKVNDWISRQVKNRPQEKSMYVDAVRRYRVALNEEAAAGKSNEASS